MQKTYTEIVDLAKVAARDTLRMEKINKWLSRKADLETKIKDNLESLNKRVADIELDSAVNLFEATHLHEDHPRRAERIAKAQEAADNNTKYINKLKESTTAFNKGLDEELAEVNKAITEWTDGTRKVELDRLNTLAKCYVEKAVLEDLLTSLNA